MKKNAQHSKFSPKYYASNDNLKQLKKARKTWAYRMFLGLGFVFVCLALTVPIRPDSTQITKEKKPPIEKKLIVSEK